MFVVIAVPESSETIMITNGVEIARRLTQMEKDGLTVQIENCLQRRDGSWFGVRSIWDGNKLRGVWMEH